MSISTVVNEFAISKELILDYLTVINVKPSEIPLRQVNNLADLTNTLGAQLNLGILAIESPIKLTLGGGLVVDYTGGIVNINGIPVTVSAGSITVSAGIVYGTIFVSASGVIGVVQEGSTFPSNSYPLGLFSSDSVSVTSLTTSNNPSIQPYNPRLQSISTVAHTPGNESMLYFNGSDSFAVSATTSVGRDLLKETTLASMRGYLGLTIGSDVQAYSGLLQSIVNTGGVTDNIFYTSSTNNVSLAPITAYARGFLTKTGPPYNDVQSYLGLVLGVNVQEFHVGLESIGNLTTGVDSMIYTTSEDTYDVTPTTSYGRDLLNAADASASRSLTQSALRTRLQQSISSDTVASWGGEVDYVIDNTSNPVQLTFPSPTVNEVGLHSIVWVKADPSLGSPNVVTIKSTASTFGHFINSVEYAGNLRAEFSSSPSQVWFYIRVQVVATQTIAVGSSEPFTVFGA